MSTDSRVEQARDVGGRIYGLLVRAIAAVVVLAVFAGLAVLVYQGRLNGDALLLYAGVLLGYILHATKQAV